MANYEIQDWNQLEDTYHRSSLLLGNGASRAVWPNFAYQSLFAAAQDGGIEHPLEVADLELFKNFGQDTNFERVLFALLVAQEVNTIVNLNDERHIDPRYESIRRALFEAVRSIHVEWSQVGPQRLLSIREYLRQHTKVFSTNYDLLIYWAMLARDNAEGFVDFFWNREGVFNYSDRKPHREEDTQIFFLHGGIHLYRNSGGQTFKRIRELGGSLLDEAAELNGQPVIPLLISEGSSGQKLNSITNSDYLNFAYNSLLSLEGKLAIFGHSLDDTDMHLINAISHTGNREIAISVFSGLDENEKVAYMAKAHGYFPEKDGNRLLFFDSSSHPLASANLQVQAN